MRCRTKPAWPVDRPLARYHSGPDCLCPLVLPEPQTEGLLLGAGHIEYC
jgi:hypothetical protein